MLVLQIALGVVAAIALVAALRAHLRIFQRARDLRPRRWIIYPMSARAAADNPEYRTLEVAGSVFALCVIAFFALQGFMALQ